MTWGSHCPICGKDECRWNVGRICEGRLKVPAGFRVSVGEPDFGLHGVYYYLERHIKGWFRWRWMEVSGSRSRTPKEAIAWATPRVVRRCPSKIHHN